MIGTIEMKSFHEFKYNLSFEFIGANILPIINLIR